MTRYSYSLYRSNDTYTVHRYKNREEWLEGRVRGIGGSDASATMGRHPWKSNLELWELKTGRKKAQDISNNERVQYGIDAEDILRQLYRLDRKQLYDVHYMADVVVSNNEHPEMLYSPDGLLWDKEKKRLGILEVKTATPILSLQREKWRDKLPDNYYIQVLHGMNVLGADFVELYAKLTYDEYYSQLRIYHIERDEVQEDLEAVRDGVLNFWRDYVLSDIEPPLTLPEI